MKLNDTYTSGCMDTSIGSILEEAPEFFLAWEWILVTALDSIVDVAASPAGVAVLSTPGTLVLGRGIALRTAVFQEVVRQNELFTGFDEVWCFDNVPQIEKPDSISLVAPICLGLDTPDVNMVQWMSQTSCALGMGDGVGLNYLGTQEAVALMAGLSGPL